MVLFRRALMHGAGRVLQHWPLVLPLYAVSLVLGVLQTWPVWSAVGHGALHNPALATLAAGNTDAVLNIVLSSGLGVAAATGGTWVVVAILFAALFGLAYNLFAGGILSVYAGTRRFWAGCRQTFWSFTGLGVVIVALVLVALVAGVLAGLVGGNVIGLIVALVLVLFINVVGEYARAVAVTHERRNPFVLVWLALRLCVRKLPAVLGFVVLALAISAALTAVYGGLATVLRGSVALVLVQQLLVLFLVALKLLRLGWALSYVEAIRAA